MERQVLRYAYCPACAWAWTTVAKFFPDSGFAAELSAYFKGERWLPCRWPSSCPEELGRMENPSSCDLLVVDFEDQEKAARHAAVGDDATEEEIAATEAAEAVAYQRAQRAFTLACCCLRANPAFHVHEVGRGEDGRHCNNIERHHAILPETLRRRLHRLRW